MKQLDGTGLKRLHRQWRKGVDARLALVLDQVSSPFNVGSIVRSAAAYRVDDVWLCGDTPDLDAAKVRKTALGCDRYLRWHRVDDAADAIDAARTAGYRVVALELADRAEPLHEIDLSGDVCLVVGNEDRGLAPDVLGVCDEVAFLPQLGRIGSLNVSVATAIACYEARRHHWP